MPAVSQQQQKLFGLALAVKRGEVSPSEVSDEVKDIVDRMSEKDIEDFAGTSHKGLPKKVEQQMREMVREIMRERVISELNEENPCWNGYEQIGMKMKDGKEVPNCVPKNESVNESSIDVDVYRKKQAFVIGPKFAEVASDKDVELMARLKRANSEHAWQLKQNISSMDHLYKKYKIQSSKVVEK